MPKRLMPRRLMLAAALLLTLLAVYAVQNEDELARHELAAVRTDNKTRPEKAGKDGASSVVVTGLALARPAINQASTNTVFTGSNASSLLPDLTQQKMLLQQSLENSAQPAARDLFKAHPWYVAPVAQPAAASTGITKPSAPALPFVYMGKLEDSPQGTLIFLSIRNRVQTVQLGQIIDGVWRLDKEDATALTLTYLPLAITQVLSKSSRQTAPAGNPSSSSETAMPVEESLPSEGIPL